MINVWHEGQINVFLSWMDEGNIFAMEKQIKYMFTTKRKIRYVDTPYHEGTNDISVCHGGIY